MIWARMRADIALARQLLNEREQAIDQAEAALVKVRELYGLQKRASSSGICSPPPVAVVAAVGAACGCGAASAWLANVRTCEGCGVSFVPHSGRQRWCTTDCRIGRKPNGAPLPEQICRYCGDAYRPRDAEQTTCSDLCRRCLKEDSYAREFEREHAAA